LVEEWDVEETFDIGALGDGVGGEGAYVVIEKDFKGDG